MVSLLQRKMFVMAAGHSYRMRPIVHLLRSKIIPWIKPDFMQKRIVIARSPMDVKNLPAGVSVSPREIVGERKVFKARRKHGNLRLYTAFWPKDNLQETTVPRISCVVHGSATHFHGKYRIRCNEGTFLIIPPGTPHQQFGPFLEEPNQEKGYCVLVHAYAYRHGVLFWLTTSRGYEHINDYTDNFLFSNTALAQLLTQAVEEAVASQVDANLITHSCLTAFFAIVAREIEADNYVAFHPQENPSSGIRLRSEGGFAEEVREYIEANCHRMLKVEEVARYLYMSNSHFFRQMQRNNLNFTELLTHYRIEQACRLLRDTDLTSTDIAGKVSYKSSTYFQNLFRSRTGCTPLEYRRRSRHSSKKTERKK